MSTAFEPTRLTPQFAIPRDWRLADLQQRLGDIPAERIRLNPPPGYATEEDHGSRPWHSNIEFGIPPGHGRRRCDMRCPTNGCKYKDCFRVYQAKRRKTSFWRIAVGCRPAVVPIETFDLPDGSCGRGERLAMVKQGRTLRAKPTTDKPDRICGDDALWPALVPRLRGDDAPSRI